MNILNREVIQRIFTHKEGVLYWRSCPSKPTHWNTRCAGKIAGYTDAKGYRCVRVMGTTYKIHRLIYALFYNDLGSREIDHIDRDPLNNAIENLRPVTRLQNLRNMISREGVTSMFVGVSWSKRDNKWISQITHNGKVKWLGSYDSEIDAAKARDVMALRIDPVHYALNFSYPAKGETK